MQARKLFVPIMDICYHYHFRSADLVFLLVVVIAFGSSGEV